MVRDIDVKSLDNWTFPKKINSQKLVGKVKEPYLTTSDAELKKFEIRIRDRQRAFITT